MSFDFAIGLNKAELDSLSQNLYRALYSLLFVGSTKVHYADEEFDVEWNVKAPAVFDLSGVPGSVAGFSFTYPQVELTISSPGVAKHSLTVTVIARARMIVNADGSQSIDVYEVDCPPLPEPVDNWIFQKAIAPKILAAAQQAFGAVKIPPLQVPGIQVSAPVPFVREERLIAIANIGPNPPPVPDPGSFPWPGNPFFLLLGQRGLQAAADYAVGRGAHFQDSGSGGGSFAGYDWGYSLSLGGLQVGIAGDAISFRGEAGGSAWGSVHIAWVVETGIQYEVRTNNLSGVLQPFVEGNFLYVRSLDIDVSISVTPRGNLLEEILGYALEGAQAIVGSFDSYAQRYLENLKFPAFEIPSYHLEIGSVRLTATPVSLTTIGAGGMLGLGGQILVTT